MAYYAEFSDVRKTKNGIEVRVDFYPEEGKIEFQKDYSFGGDETRPGIIQIIKQEIKRLNSIAPLEVLIKEAIEEKTRITE